MSLTRRCLEPRLLSHGPVVLPLFLLRQYTLHTKLGDGMTATVFVAFDRDSKKTCACKLAERKARQPNWSRLVKVSTRLPCCLMAVRGSCSHEPPLMRALQVLKHESAMLLRIGEHPNIVRHHGFYLGSNQVAL